MRREARAADTRNEIINPRRDRLDKKIPLLER